MEQTYQTYLWVAVLLNSSGVVVGKSLGGSEDYARADCERWAAQGHGNYATLHCIATQSGERFGDTRIEWVLD